MPVPVDGADERAAALLSRLEEHPRALDDGTVVQFQVHEAARSSEGDSGATTFIWGKFEVLSSVSSSSSRHVFCATRTIVDV